MADPPDRPPSTSSPTTPPADDDPAALDLSALLGPGATAAPSGGAPTTGRRFKSSGGAPGAGDTTPTISEELREPRVSKGAKLGVALAIAIPLGILVVVVAAWAADSTLGGDDTTSRGVSIAGREVSAQSRESVEAVVAEVAADVAAQPVTITTPEGTLETTWGELGITVDEAATTEDALAIGHTESLAVRPIDWLGGLVGDRPAPVTYRVNQALVEFRLQDLLAANTVVPVDPTIEATGEGWQVVPGTTGEVLDLEAAVAALAAAVESGGAQPLDLALEPVTREPRWSDDEMSALAAEADRLTGDPITIEVEGTTADASPDVLRSFFEPVSDEDALRMRMKQDRFQEWLAQTFSGLTVEPTDARFEIGFGVVVTPSADGRICCTDEAPSQLRAALDAGQAAVTLDMTVLEPDLTTDEANALGIVEPVASFTTNHKCCEGRVQNIHRFADLIRGAVIQPGETFSLNEYVGQRTEEKGFVEAGAIYAGVYVQDVGGGVSQFATTTFNAAFFAGLDFAEYQAHTIYISRYPYGREATISWPSPDLKLTNNSPYGILIVPSYSDTSITVTLWSTKWVDAEQTAQSERGIGGGCTRVTTERTRRFLDPAEAERIRGGPAEEGQAPNEVVDNVFAIYQPAEGVLC